MNGPKVIAYDLGTGGIKASLFSAAGEILKSVFISYPTHFPQPDWQEQAPDDWWNAVVRSTRELLKKSGVSPDEIVSLAISGHSLGVVPIGKQGQLLRRTTPIWSDQRAVREAEEFFSRTDYRAWYERTGNGFPPACYSVFKIMWYRTHEPEMFAAIDRVIGTKDYCNYRLTGRLCTDASYASGSGVFDLRAWEYEPAYIQAAGLDFSIFPEILPSDAVVGTLTEEAARETGLNPRTKVIAGGVDNSCMALGAGGIRAGEIYTSLGSSAWIAAIGDAPVIDFERKPYVFAHLIPGLYTSATCIFSAGNSFRWVRDTLCADLLPFGIYADFAQQLAGPVLADFRAVDIEQYRKGAAVLYVIVVSILFHIVTYSLRLLYDHGETFRNFLIQGIRVRVYLVVRHFGVDLRSFYPAVAKHPADRLKRNPMRQGDFRGVGMTCQVEDEPAAYSADTRYAFQIKIHRTVGVHRQQPAVRCGVPVLFNNPQWKIQKWNFELYSCLFPYGLYPPRPVVGQVKVVSCQQPHVSVWDTGIAGEQEHVPHMV